MWSRKKTSRKRRVPSLTRRCDSLSSLFRLKRLVWSNWATVWATTRWILVKWKHLLIAMCFYGLQRIILYLRVCIQIFHNSSADVPDNHMNSPLHFASREDNCPTVIALIRGGADVNIKGDSGRTPLHLAVSKTWRHWRGHTLDVTVHDVTNVITRDMNATPRKFVFNVTSIGQRSSSWTGNSVEVEMKLHLECKLHLPCAQLTLRQMHRTNVSESIEAKCWVSWLSFDV